MSERLDSGEVEILLIWDTVSKVMIGGRDGSENSFLDNFINSSINNKVIFYVIKILLYNVACR